LFTHNDGVEQSATRELSLVCALRRRERVEKAAYEEGGGPCSVISLRALRASFAAVVKVGDAVLQRQP